LCWGRDRWGFSQSRQDRCCQSSKPGFACKFQATGRVLPQVLRLLMQMLGQLGQHCTARCDRLTPEQPLNRAAWRTTPVAGGCASIRLYAWLSCWCPCPQLLLVCYWRRWPDALVLSVVSGANCTGQLAVAGKHGHLMTHVLRACGSLVVVGASCFLLFWVEQLWRAGRRLISPTHRTSC
jgi:hypothetical protein